jgi:RND family efflux transporter MFP subunit
MSRTYLTRIASVVALAILAGCSNPSDGASATSHQVQAPQEVTVALPETRRITQRITLTATIEAYEQVALYAKVAGYVKTLDVDIGDRVRAGQLLATLEVPEIQSQLRRAQSDAELAQIVFTRSQRLRAKDAITQEDLDNARANFQARRARLTEINTMVDYSRITSPIDGVVTRRFVDPGALMQAATSTNNATPIITVARANPLRVFVDVPEPDAPLIARGAPAALQVESLPHQTFDGNVTRYADALDPSTRTMRTEVDLTNRSGQLRPGMFGDLTITLEDHPHALTLRESQVRKDNTGSFVYLVQQRRVIKRTLVTGIVSDGLVEIVSGLGQEDQVVTSGENLSNGEPVRVVAGGTEPVSGAPR